MRTRFIHLVAKALGLLIHIDGLPYGRARGKLEKGNSGSTCSSETLYG